MRMPGFVLVLVMAGNLTGGVAAAQQSPPPPDPTTGPPVGQVIGGVVPGVPPRPTRDPRMPPAVGTGTIRGRVVDGVTGAPLARVRVRYQAREPRSTLTDTDGTFTFTKVPPGNVNLFAEKAGYLPSFLPERRRSMRGGFMPLANGQTIDNLTISMIRGGAIAGRLLDPHGDPVENVQVQAISVGSSRRAQMFRRMQGGPGTNDIGEFRIARLEPGSYYLFANPVRRGGPDDEGTGMARTFYPGVASIEQAQPITVEKGQTVIGIEFPLLETTLAKVSGSVITTKGEPVTGGNISVRSAGPPGTNSFTMMSYYDGGTGIRNDGTFELHLQPGEYTLEAMPMVGPRGGGAQNQGTRERGQVRVTIGQEPIVNLVIATGNGATATGRLVFNGKKPPPDVRNAQIFIQSAPGSDECRTMGMVRPTINPDGTFVAEHLWGSCQVRAGSVGGWQLEAVMHRGTDVTNRSIAFTPDQTVSDLQVVFTDRLGDLSLEVADESGAPLAEYVAIVFPVEKERWNDPRFIRTHVGSPAMDAAMALSGAQGRAMMSAQGMSMMTTTAPTANSGQTVQVVPVGPGTVSSGRAPIVRGLLTGDYFAVAVDDVGFEDLRDPDFLAQLAQVAVRVSIAEGDARPIQLRRVPVPETER